MYHSTAQGLASLGRGKDTMLVHMTPREVSGLQSLALAHGGSLTINPKTGLPEAGILDSMLPQLIGIGVGSAMGMPWLGAALAGGLGYAQSGSLLKGLMSGIGAYGGTGLMTGLEGSGLNALQQQAVVDAAGNIPMEDIISANLSRAPLEAAAYNPFSQGLGPTGMYGAGVGDMPGFLPARSGVPVDFISSGTGGYDLTPQLQAAQQAGANLQPTYFDKVSQGVKGAIESPKSFMSATPTGAGATGFTNKTNMMMAGIPLALTTAQAAAQPGIFKGLAGGAGGAGAPAQYYNTNYAQGVPNPNYGKPGHEGEPPLLGQGYYGGEFSPTYRAPTVTLTAADGGLMQENYPGARIPHRLAEGGMASLPEYKAGGRLLDGPGDGMSDSIPAVIRGEQTQRAALSDNEFVIPADVVSHLGNGSTNAGAKRLYAMMDRVRKARTGRTRQSPQINAVQYLPT